MRRPRPPPSGRPRQVRPCDRRSGRTARAACRARRVSQPERPLASSDARACDRRDAADRPARPAREGLLGPRLADDHGRRAPACGQHSPAARASGLVGGVRPRQRRAARRRGASRQQLADRPPLRRPRRRAPAAAPTPSARPRRRTRPRRPGGVERRGRRSRPSPSAASTARTCRRRRQSRRGDVRGWRRVEQCRSPAGPCAAPTVVQHHAGPPRAAATARRLSPPTRPRAGAFRERQRRPLDDLRGHGYGLDGRARPAR